MADTKTPVFKEADENIEVVFKFLEIIIDRKKETRSNFVTGKMRKKTLLAKLTFTSSHLKRMYFIIKNKHKF